MTKNKQAYILAYIPVLNQGYLDMFLAHNDAIIGVLDTDVLQIQDYLRKDIRAVNPKVIVQIINNSGIGKAELINLKELQYVLHHNKVIMPDDDVTKSILAQHKKVTVNTYPVFLRWHRENVKLNKTITADKEISISGDDPIIKKLEEEASHSSDWWRQVGACIVGDKKVIISGHNNHKPSAYTPHIDSEMRAPLGKGDGIELITAEHAEATILAQCAKKGIKTDGLDIYVSAFPCPPCAKFIASAGIKRVFFLEGYAVGDGLESLKQQDIEVIKVNTGITSKPGLGSRPYPEK